MQNKDNDSFNALKQTHTHSFIKALAMDKEDTVATSIVNLDKNFSTTVLFPDGSTVEVVVHDSIPAYHKFALVTIPSGQQVLKYGHPIGRSTAHIDVGRHVHLHNMASEWEDE